MTSISRIFVAKELFWDGMSFLQSFSISNVLQSSSWALVVNELQRKSVSAVTLNLLRAFADCSSPFRCKRKNCALGDRMTYSHFRCVYGLTNSVWSSKRKIFLCAKNHPRLMQQSLLKRFNGGPELQTSRIGQFDNLA